MEQFIPNEELLEKIYKDRKRLAYTHFTFPRNIEEKCLEDILRSYHPTLGNLVGEFYNLGLEPMKTFDYTSFLEVFREGLTNAIAHGSKNCNQIIYGLFLGDKGILHGFKDFGGYFKSQKTKNLWENKISIPSTRNSNFSGYGAGDRIIYDLSDFINVDTQKGILYCGQTHERLEINPGKFYF